MLFIFLQEKKSSKIKDKSFPTQASGKLPSKKSYDVMIFILLVID